MGELTKTLCDEYGHTWVAGMLYVHSEDVAEVHAAGRRVECERCETVYCPGSED